MVRGLQEAFDYMDDIGRKEIFSTDARILMAKNKLLTGNMKRFITKDYELQTQSKLFFECVFDISTRLCNYSIKVPTLIRGGFISSYLCKYYSKDELISALSSLVFYLKSDIITGDSLGNLEVSFLCGYIDDSDLLIGVVDDEIVFMIKFVDRVRYIKSALEDDVIRITFLIKTDKWTLSLSLKDYSIIDWSVDID